MEKPDDNQEQQVQKTQPPATATAARPALNLGEQPANTQSASDYGRIAELERQVQTMRVENGRVKALSERVRELEAQNAELLARAEKAEASTAGRDIMDDIPADLRSQVDPVQAQAFGAVLDKRLKSRRDEDERLRREREEEIARMKQERFLEQVEAKFPGFLRDTNTGGDKFDAWNEFLKDNRPIVLAAFNSCDIGSFSTIVKSFLSEAGVPQRGVTRTETPSPTSVATADLLNPNGQKRFYTPSEFAALVEKTGDDYRAGRITNEEYRKVRAELSAARLEGRVKG